MAGAHLLSSGGTHYNVSRTVVHPHYTPFGHLNDLAVLHTATEIAFTMLVQPIALPTTDTVVEGKFPALVSGWGLKWVSFRCQTFCVHWNFAHEFF